MLGIVIVPGNSIIVEKGKKLGTVLFKAFLVFRYDLRLEVGLGKFLIEAFKALLVPGLMIFMLGGGASLRPIPSFDSLNGAPTYVWRGRAPFGIKSSVFL